MRHHTEPTHDIRMIASAHWQLFVAYQAEGFTEAQAMALVIAMITATDTSS